MVETESKFQTLPVPKHMNMKNVFTIYRIKVIFLSCRYPDDELFLGPQDDGIPQSFLESFTAIFVLNAQHPPCGTR